MHISIENNLTTCAFGIACICDNTESRVAGSILAHMVLFHYGIIPYILQ